MKSLIILSALLLAGFAAADPIKTDILTLTEDFYLEDLVVYTGENEITNIVVPLNSINFNDHTDLENFDVYVFFVEADKGLYVLKNNVATKVLDNGKDVASSMDDSTQVFIGATDGIYTFNAEKKTAEKYGTLTDNIKNILVTNGTDEIFILTEDKVFYKVTEEGTKKEEITNVKDAIQVVLDPLNNLYFVDSKKHVYVKSFEDGTVRKVKGVPANPKFVELLRPPAIVDDGVPFISGKKVYDVHANATAEFTGLVLTSKPSAYAVEATLVLYFAHDKKIYQYSVVDIINSTAEMMGQVKSFIEDKAPQVKEAAQKKSIRL
ncbi:hypothetical protein ABMA27_010135 [Loxostege sticticalis]|uniref:Uncharacterized protein n=1 Tax=Loxostege sticticalis TaxID=481309 RepID=A0ABR3H4Q1_LOXSC